MNPGRRAVTAIAAIAAIGLLTLAPSCTSDDSGSGRATASTSNGGEPSGTVPSTTSTTTWVPVGLPNDDLIEIALAALDDEGITVGDDREAVVRRGNSEVDVAFPTRSDLPPVIGGEPHVPVEPVSGAVIDIVRTR